MIDLQPAIRARILQDATITSLLSVYKGSFGVFTRKPVPEDAVYPMIVISPIVTDREEDWINCQKRILTYDVVVYGNNDDATKYRNVEKIASRLTAIFHRMPRFALTMPSGSGFIQSTASAPMPAPVDDNQKTGRIVIVNIEVTL